MKLEHLTLILVLSFSQLEVKGLEQATPLTIVNRAPNVWEEIAYSAAEEALKAIQRSTRADLTLRDVPLETLQVLVGRQHELGVSVDGTQYDVVLGGEAELGRQAAARHAQQALPQGSQGPSSLVALDWWHQHSHSHSLTLPEVTLSGPMELVLSQPCHVSFFTPHAADVGAVRRVVLAAGVNVRVSGMRSIALRRPVDLPRLPAQYLAEVYAHARLGEPEEGYHLSPGIHYLSHHLRDAALNSTTPLLTFEVEPEGGPSGVAGGLVVSSISQAPGEGVAPRLKVKRLPGGGVELSRRQGEVASPEHSRALSRASLSHVWAWPLPHLDMGTWLPYEQLLRGILASHPFDLRAVQDRGIGLQLTKSSIRGVRLLAFEMELRGHEVVEGVEEGGAFQKEEYPLEVYEVIVQVKERSTPLSALASSQGAHPAFSFLPLSIKRKGRYGNTVTVSSSAMAEARAVLMGATNATLPLPLGFESEDLGVARHAGRG